MESETMKPDVPSTSVIPPSASGGTIRTPTEAMSGRPYASFFVHGMPQSQGSLRAFVVGGKPILTSTNKNVGDWRRLIAGTAQEHAVMIEGAVYVDAAFYMPRPKSLPKKVRHCIKRPDIDKLQRALFDALTGVFYKDDSQIVGVHVLKKYADGIHPIGVKVEIWGT
jgi:crossover junction endodeoxyribonuclease RusA